MAIKLQQMWFRVQLGVRLLNDCVVDLSLSTLGYHCLPLQSDGVALSWGLQKFINIWCALGYLEECEMCVGRFLELLPRLLPFFFVFGFTY